MLYFKNGFNQVLIYIINIVLIKRIQAFKTMLFIVLEETKCDKIHVWQISIVLCGNRYQIFYNKTSEENNELQNRKRYNGRNQSCQ